MIVASELYDYKNDPDETVNVAGEKEYSAVLKEMNKKIVNFLNLQAKL